MTSAASATRFSSRVAASATDVNRRANVVITTSKRVFFMICPTSSSLLGSIIREFLLSFVNKNWRQGIVERGAYGPDQLRFGDAQPAVVPGCRADCAQERLFALAIQPKQNVEAVIKH